MTTLGIQNQKIRLHEQRAIKARQHITLGVIALTAIAIIAVVALIGADTLKAQQQLAIQQYKHSQCELMSDKTAANYWYECPAIIDK